MGRGWKIGIGLLAALIVLLGINAVLIGGETKGATVTVPGGKILDLPSGQVQVVEGGPESGPPIVLIHCFTCAIDWWDGVRPILERRHRVVAIDLLGHGGSEKPDSGYGAADQAEMVAEAMRRLGVRRAEVVGHSLGGEVAVALAQRSPRLVDRVVILDTEANPDEASLDLSGKLLFVPIAGEAIWRVKPDAAIRDGLSVAFAPGFDVPDAFVTDVNRMTYSAYDDSGSGFDDYLHEAPLDQRMAEAGQPLLVMMGAEEQLIDDPAESLAEYRRGLPGVETHLIAGSGHSPNVEKPAETARLILEFGSK